MTRKKKACFYGRYSSERQNETSIYAQRGAVEDYCQSNGYELVTEYVDEALTGTNMNREGFQNMLEDSRNNPDWDTIIVYDYSRLFRNFPDAVAVKEEWRRRGIKTVSVTEKYSEVPIMEIITDYSNAEYSKMTARKTHAGMILKAKQGKHCGGVCPLGYRLDVGTGNVVVDELEEDTVKEIFRMYNLGYSYNRMAKELNDRGLKTKTGKKFSKNSFYHILTQEKYIGTYRWNKRQGKNLDGKRNNRAYKPEDEQIIIEGGYPAIISKELFEQTQQRLKENGGGQSDSKSRNHYMLSSLKILKCAHCGAYMVGKVTTSHGKKYTSYSCPNHKGKTCPMKDINTEGLDRYVAAKLVTHYIPKDRLDEVNKLCQNNAENRDRQALQKKIRNLQKSINTLSQNLQYQTSETLVQKLISLENERDAYKEELAHMTEELLLIDSSNLTDVRRSVSQMLRDSDSPNVKEFLRSAIDEILVGEEEVVVNLR